MPFAGTALPLTSVRLSDVVVQVDGTRARALFRVEAEGAGRVRLGYVGGEQARLALGARGWGLAGPRLPRRVGGRAAGDGRRQAVGAREPAALAALALDGGVPPLAALSSEPAPLAYFVRVEGDHATVSEVARAGAGQPTHQRELRFSAGRWRFSSGLL